MKQQYKELTDAKLISLLFEELYKTDMLIQCRLEELKEIKTMKPNDTEIMGES